MPHRLFSYFLPQRPVVCLHSLWPPVPLHPTINLNTLFRRAVFRLTGTSQLHLLLFRLLDVRTSCQAQQSQCLVSPARHCLTRAHPIANPPRYLAQARTSPSPLVLPTLYNHLALASFWTEVSILLVRLACHTWSIHSSRIIPS